MKYEELAKVNVNEHVEKKQNLSYLSWAWALDYMTRLDENSEWEYREWDGKPYLTLPDGTCMVYCTVRFCGRSKTAHLPVMDYKNKAIPNPDAFAINTTMQRALVKAIALHGLGLYIYAGEDLPKDEADKQAAPKDTATALANANIKPLAGAREALKPAQLQKVEGVANSVLDAFTAEWGVETVLQIIDEGELDNDEKVALWTYFDSKQRAAIKKASEARRAAKQPVAA